MIDEPRIVSSEEHLTAVIRFTIPRHEIQQVMGPAIGEVMGVVAAQGIGPAGPVFSYHLRMDPETFDFEVGVPVRSEVKPSGRVRPGRLRAATVARTVYHGPYEGLGPAWCDFEKWIAAAGREAAPDLWEFYVAGPESGSDPSRWRTELNRPLVR